MSSLYENIKNRRIQLGLSQEQLANKMGYTSRSTIAKIEAGVNDIPQSKIQAFAKALDTTPGILMGYTGENHSESNLTALDNKKVYNIPVYENVSAGFGALALDYIIDYMPLYIESSFEAKETLCIKVTGDSMYPKIEHGDIIQVHKQMDVDSGSIAVVLRDGEEGLVKKVVYGDDWIELQSINPMYPPQRYEKKDVNRISIVGAVKKIIKSV